jgi:phenylpropionate dioxygenase-like ring-hydroxylating dioxygenase large terminal subunit
MLCTRQPVLRRFWYAVAPLAALSDEPTLYTLLGETITLAVSASTDTVTDTGAPSDDARPKIRATAHPDSPPPRVEARYGYAWVALDEPLQPIPGFAEDGRPGYRRILQFRERWATSSLRFMENAFDNAHFSFVHAGTFGRIDQPTPSVYEIVDNDWGFEATTIVPIRNSPRGYRISGTQEAVTERVMSNRWIMPFVRRFGCTYAASGRQHIIYNCATPIDDGHIMITQWLYRNDTEADCSIEELAAWERSVLDEDRVVLESTDPDVCIDVTRRVECHMPSDRPGILMRKMMLQLLRDHGEDEVHAAKEPRR